MFMWILFLFLARLSKRSLIAVATFMTTGLLSATLSSTVDVVAKLFHTAEGVVNSYYPTESSSFASSILLAVFGGMTLPLLLSSKAKDDDKGSCDGGHKKSPMAMISAMIFSTGLFISGMTKNYKIVNFLDLKLLKQGGWDPTLMFVMGSGLLASAASYHWVEGHNIFKVRFFSKYYRVKLLVILTNLN